MVRAEQIASCDIIFIGETEDIRKQESTLQKKWKAGEQTSHSLYGKRDTGYIHAPDIQPSIRWRYRVLGIVNEIRQCDF